MTPQTVRWHLIDALAPHFSKPRVASDRFFEDLTTDVCNAGFDAAVLDRAASILRSERSGVFPKITVVIGACRRAAAALAVEGSGSSPAESRSPVGETSGQVEGHRRGGDPAPRVDACNADSAARDEVPA